MSNHLNIFTFEGKAPIRASIHPDNPLFVAKDVCDVLKIEKYRDAISRLDEDERGSLVVDTPGGPQEMAAVSESGLYALIFKSRKAEAKRFRKWVTSEVLPAIRKTGAYAHPDLKAQGPEAVLSALGWHPEWKQTPAEKLEQARKDSKGSYELLKNKVVPALERIEAKPIECLGDIKPKEALQLLNAIARVTKAPKALAASKRLFPALFGESGASQPTLPGMEEAV